MIHPSAHRWLWCLTLLCWCHLLPGQTLHAVLFAATEDVKIGKGNEISARLLSTEIRRISNNLEGVKLNLLTFYGQDCSIDQLENTLAYLSRINLENDIVFFAFLGHGYNDVATATDWPHLLFYNTDGPISNETLHKHSYPLHQLVDQLETNNPRLLFVYAEACNNQLEDDKFLSFVDPEAFVPAPPDVLNSEKCKDLFLGTEGTLIMTSSSKKEPSYVSNTEGGVFTQSFIKALQAEITSHQTYPASFNSLFQNLKHETRAICNRINRIQTPQFAIFPKEPRSIPLTEAREPNLSDKLSRLFSSNKIRNNFKKALDKGDLVHLKIQLPPGEEGDQLKQKLLKKNPLMYYVGEGLVSEALQDTALALLNYNVAYHLLTKEQLFTTEDVTIMEEMKIQDIFDITGIQDFKNFYDWLSYKSNYYSSIYANQIALLDKQILAYKREIEALNRSIQEDYSLITTYEKDAIQLEQQMQRLDRNRTQMATVEIPNLQKLNQQELDHLRALFERIEEGALVDSKSFRFDGDSKVSFKFAKRKTSSNIRPTANGFEMGQHCSEDLRQTTSQLMDILTLAIDKVPSNQKRQIQVNLQLTGNSDWIGGTDRPNIWYRPDRNIYEEYTDIDGNTHIFSATNGQAKFITNKDLAFLRAYCTYGVIQEVLAAKGIQSSQIAAYFTGIAHPQPIQLPAGSIDPGKAFRGVDINISLENVYRHYVDQIEALQRQLLTIEEQQEGLLVGIEEKRQQIRRLNDRIYEAKARKRQLEQVVNAADASGLESQAQSEIQQALEQWNH